MPSRPGPAALVCRARLVPWDNLTDTPQDNLQDNLPPNERSEDRAMTVSGERDYQRSHPWINFHLNLRQANPRLWVLLGQIVAFGEFVSRALLPPKVASDMARIYLAKGVRATVAIEGNTLSEEEVLAQIDHELELPASKEYLGTEVRNVVDAANEIVERIRRGHVPPVTAGFVADCNRRILTGLSEVLGEEVAPGRVREHSVVVGRYRGAPAQDCDYLLDRLGDWLEGIPQITVLGAESDNRVATGVLRAVLAHLYIAWIHPFGDGNGRTSRLVELSLLARVLPFPSAQLLSNHYNDTRAAYYRELARSSQANQRHGDPTGFLLYALQGLSDGLREQCRAVTRVHHEIAWRDFVYRRFDEEELSSAMLRRRQLVLELPPVSDPVPKEGIPVHSMKLAHSFAGLNPKTLDRDLNWLLQEKLVVRAPGGYAANRDLMQAFVVPGAPRSRTRALD